MLHLTQRLARSRQGEQSRPMRPNVHAGVGQEHDRRLQALGAMHRHDADLVAVLLHVALDLDVAAAQLIDEALQRRRRLAVIGESDVEELIDRLRRLRPEPDEHALTHPLTLGAEQLREELVRRQQIRAGEPGAQAPMRLGEARIGACLVLERRPQRMWPLIGEVEQSVVVESEQRALQHDGEREIVLRHQQHVGERDEVLHGELVHQLHAVGAGDRHALALERADHRRGEGVAPADEDQDVARFHLAAFGKKLLARNKPMLDERGDASAQLINRACAGRAIVPGLEGLCLLDLLLGQRLPQLDQPGIALPEGVMFDDRVLDEDEAACGGRLGEYRVNGVEHRRGRAEREIERDLMEAEPRRLSPALEGAADFAEPRRVCALERVDRLFLIAHGEQRARPFARTGTGEELLCQALDDRPLRRVRVLRLVDQDMIDAAVDLVQHPGCGARAREQIERLDDQIVIVERGLAALPPLVIAHDRVGEEEHGAARFRHAEMRKLVLEMSELGLCTIEHGCDHRLGLGEALAANLCSGLSPAFQEHKLQRRRPVLCLAFPGTAQIDFGLLVELLIRREMEERG